MSSAAAFTSHVLVVVAFLVWTFYQDTKEEYGAKTGLLSPHHVSVSLEKLAEHTRSWSDLSAWLETSLAIMLLVEKQQHPVAGE